MALRTVLGGIEGGHLTKGGTYLLALSLPERAEITIGRLGCFAFQSGWYAYTGSALGPGGLEARLARHSRKNKRTHWHIDYLLECATLKHAWQVECMERLECAWATAICQLPGVQMPITGFGSSDCRCPTHLFYWPGRLPNLSISAALAETLPSFSALRHFAYDDPNGRFMSTPS